MNGTLKDLQESRSIFLSSPSKDLLTTTSFIPFIDFRVSFMPYDTLPVLFADLRNDSSTLVSIISRPSCICLPFQYLRVLWSQQLRFQSLPLVLLFRPSLLLPPELVLLFRTQPWLKRLSLNLQFHVCLSAVRSPYLSSGRLQAIHVLYQLPAPAPPA